MSTKLYYHFLILLIYSSASSQSFENISLLNNNSISFPYNESNAYLNPDGSMLFFNSSYNTNNFGGSNSLNDVWYRNNNNGLWSFPINLSEINTIEDDIVLGLNNSNLIVLSNGIVNYYDINNNFKLLKKENLEGFSSNYSVLSGSINKSFDIIYLSFDGYGTYGVEDIYISKKIDDKWSRLSNIGSLINSEYQDISPTIINDDTLAFISNRNGLGYELFYSVFIKKNTWSTPVKMKILNTNKSEVSLTSNFNYDVFLLSASNDSKTNSDIFFYGTKKVKINVTFNFNSDINNGLILINNDSILFNSNTFSMPFTISDKYKFKFIVDNFFIKDTIININNTKDISINLDPIESGSRVVLKNLIFKRSTADLNDESVPYLNDLLHLFKINSDIKITLEGHTDNRGDFKSNIKLSKERSEYIKRFLVSSGLKKSQIKVKGLGPTKPRYSNESETLRKLNRRVELYIN